MDSCGGQSYDGAGNMAGRYAGVLTLIQHQFPKFILLLDKFLLVETSHANCWIHPCLGILSFLCMSGFMKMVLKNWTPNLDSMNF